MDKARHTQYNRVPPIYDLYHLCLLLCYPLIVLLCIAWFMVDDDDIRMSLANIKVPHGSSNKFSLL